MLNLKKLPTLKSKKMIADEIEIERLEAERREAERKEAARVEAERIEAERKAREEALRIEALRIEAERREEAECKAEFKSIEESLDKKLDEKAKKVVRDVMIWKQNQQPEEYRRAREEELSKCKAKKEEERKAREEEERKAREESERKAREEEEEERKAREESAKEIYYTPIGKLDQNLSKKNLGEINQNLGEINQNLGEINQNLGEAAYISVTGNVPSASPLSSCFGFWNIGRLLLINAAETGALGQFLGNVFKGGNGDESCPNLSIDINKIPKCFRNQKEFRDMSLILHPDKNNNCNKEDKKRAVEKFKILNSNKDEQNTNYGEINESTYELCMRTDNSNVNIRKESEEIEFFINKQEKMDSLYLESMKGKEISQDITEKINFIFNLCNEKGEKNINELNTIFETILEELYKILDIKNKIYNSTSQSISDDNTNIIKSKIKIENLKNSITQKIKEYREKISFLLRENGIHTVSEDEALLITCIIDVNFRNYIINIETLNNAINSIDGLINIKNGNKMNLLNIWFGIPQNFQITQNGGNELITINNNTQIKSFNDKVPVYGLKYELAKTPLISLIKKYKIGTLNITNLNINLEQFNKNIKDMVKDPFIFKNIPVTGGKINKKNNNNTKRIIKNKTKKIRKNQKTKRRY
jgi:hypothetical protein